MELKININDEMFNKLVEVKDDILTRDVMNELLIEGAKQYFTSEEFYSKMSNSLFYENGGYYGPKHYELTAFAKELLKSNITPEDLNVSKEKILEVIDNNSKEILYKGLSQIIIDGIFNNDVIRDHLSQAARNEIAGQMEYIIQSTKQ